MPAARCEKRRSSASLAASLFYGATAFIADDPRYHFQLQPKGGRSLAFIQCSLPKIAHGDNFSCQPRQECGEALKYVEGALGNRGVLLD